MTKYLVKLFNDAGFVQSESQFCKLSDINKAFPKIPYGKLRTIVQYTKENTKKIHPSTQKLLNKIKIYEMEEDYF
jgi:hypothetical protein